MLSNTCNWMMLKSPTNLPSVMALYFVSWMKLSSVSINPDLQMITLRKLVALKVNSHNFYFDLLASALLCLKEQTCNKDDSFEGNSWCSIALNKLPYLISQLEKERLSNEVTTSREAQQLNPIESALSQLKEFSYLCNSEDNTNSSTFFYQLVHFFHQQQLITPTFLLQFNWNHFEQFTLGGVVYSNVTNFMETIKVHPTSQQMKDIIRYIATSSKHQIVFVNFVFEIFKKATSTKNHKIINDITCGILHCPESVDVMFLYFPVAVFLKLLIDFGETSSPSGCEISFHVSLGFIYSLCILIVEHFKLNLKIQAYAQRHDGFFCGWIYSAIDNTSITSNINPMEFSQKLLTGAGVEPLLNNVSSPQEMCLIFHNVFANILRSDGLGEIPLGLVSSLLSLLAGAFSFVAIVGFRKLKFNLDHDSQLSSRFHSITLTLSQQNNLPDSIRKILGGWGLDILPKVTSLASRPGMPLSKMKPDQPVSTRCEMSIDTLFDRGYSKFMQEGMSVANANPNEGYSFSDAICDLVTALEFLGVLVFTRHAIQSINSYPQSFLRAAELSACLLAIPLDSPSLWLPQPHNIMPIIWDTVIPELLITADESQLTFSAARAVGCLASWSLLLSNFAIDDNTKNYIGLSLQHASSFENESSDVEAMDFVISDVNNSDVKFAEKLVQVGSALHYNFAQTINRTLFDEITLVPNAPITPSSSPVLGFTQSFSTIQGFIHGFLHDPQIYGFLEALNLKDTSGMS